MRPEQLHYQLAVWPVPLPKWHAQLPRLPGKPPELIPVWLISQFLPHVPDVPGQKFPARQNAVIFLLQIFSHVPQVQPAGALYLPGVHERIQFQFVRPKGIPSSHSIQSGQFLEFLQTLPFQLPKQPDFLQFVPVNQTSQLLVWPLQLLRHLLSGCNQLMTPHVKFAPTQKIPVLIEKEPVDSEALPPSSTIHPTQPAFVEKRLPDSQGLPVSPNARFP